MMKAFLYTLLIPLLSACATQVTSEVTRFHRAYAPAGETLSVLNMNAAKNGSIESETYGKLLAQHLEDLGYRVIDSGEPELLAKFSYSVGAAQTDFRAWPDNYVHYHFYFGRRHPFFFGAYWDEPYVYSYPVYPRSLDLTLETRTGTIVFEGHVRSIGRKANMNEVIEYLIHAMFQNFPGESGVTKVVTIKEGPDGRPY